MKQTAFKNIDDAKAAALELVHGTGQNYKWTSTQWAEARDELEDLGGGGWSLFASWASMPWNPTSWAGLDDYAKLEAVQSYWEAVAELAAKWESEGLRGASKIRETATQAAIASGSEMTKYKAEHPATIAAGGTAGTVEDYAEVAEGGANVLQTAAENPKTTMFIVGAVAVVGLGLYMSLILPRR